MRNAKKLVMSVSLAGMALGYALAPATASAETFRFAYQTDVQSLDPHALSETFTLGFLGNVYEGLVAYGPNLEVMPALAESWETKNPTTWVFKLRRGVSRPFECGSESHPACRFAHRVTRPPTFRRRLESHA